MCLSEKNITTKLSNSINVFACVCVCVYICIKPFTTVLVVLSASVLFSLTPETGLDDTQCMKERMKTKQEKWDVKTLKEADIYANISSLCYSDLLLPFFFFLAYSDFSLSLLFPCITTVKKQNIKSLSNAA